MISLQFEHYDEFIKDGSIFPYIKIIIHQNGEDFTAAKHRDQDIIELERGQSIKYSITKKVVRSLNTKINPCSKAKYNGKRACIEQKVKLYF